MSNVILFMTMNKSCWISEVNEALAENYWNHELISDNVDPKGIVTETSECLSLQTIMKVTSTQRAADPMFCSVRRS